MTLSLVRMRQLVRKPVGMDTDDPDLTDADIDEYLNRSFWEIQDKFPFREKEKTGTFVTQVGIRNYEMPKPFDSLISLAIVDATTTQHHPLTYASPREYELIYNESDNSEGKPRKYVREDCFARLWPTPDQAYTVVIRRRVILADISESNDTFSIPQVWYEIIVYGAVWRIFIDLGDFQRASAMKAHQVSLVNTIQPTEIKELGDTSTAGLEVIRNDNYCF